MAGSYTADEQSAAKLAGLIADGPTKLTAGIVTESTTTATTTAVVTHGLGSTPDFVICSTTQTDVITPTWAANTTSLTFTVTSATGFSISYIAGYTA